MFNKRNNNLKALRAPESCSELEGEGADRRMAFLPLGFLMGVSVHGKVGSPKVGSPKVGSLEKKSRQSFASREQDEVHPVERDHHSP